MKWRPSREPVALKAQHDPHDPWFLTGVTAPAVTQLTEEGVVLSSKVTMLVYREGLVPSICFLSASEISAIPFKPK